MFREKDNPRWAASTRKNYGKGVAFARIDGRPIIYVATPGSYLCALDADTGLPLPFFGNNGVVDLHLGVGPTIRSIPIAASSTGATSRRRRRPSSSTACWSWATRTIAAITLRTARTSPASSAATTQDRASMLWRFDPVPRKGEPEYSETWEEGFGKYTGNVSPWAPLCADSRLGLVYVPTDTPTNDYYGGSRPGKNVYGTTPARHRREDRHAPLVSTSSCITTSGTTTSRTRRT